MRELVLTRIKPDFDPGSLIAIGPWCFVGAEDVYPGWEDLDFVDPIDTSARLEDADARTRSLANQLARRWTETMNARHAREYSHKFWRTLLISWLLYTCQATWRRYRHVEEIVARHRDEPLKITVLDAAPNWTFPRTADYTEHMNAAGVFDYWLTSLIVRALAPETWTLARAAPAGSEAPAPLQKDARTTPLAAAVRHVFGRFRFDTVPGAGWTKVPFSLLTSLAPRRESDTYPMENGFDAGKAFPDTYLDILDRFLEAVLPSTYGANFTELEADAKALHYRPGRLYVDHVGTLDDRRRMVVAMASERGERLVGCQHGAWYGTARTATWGVEAEYRHHAFLTWGWTRQGELGGRMVPLASPLLSQFRDAHRFERRELYLVGAHMFFTGTRFDSVPSPTQNLAYRKLKKRFVTNLENTPREALWYRPHTKKRITMEDGAYMRRAFPDLRLLEGSLDERMLGCSLMVMDNPGTGFNLAMAANVPMVCFWEPEHWAMCRQAEPYFQALRDCGMLFDDPESAAGQVNRIWADVPSWWQSDGVQSARRAWCREYARASRWWWWEWLKTLPRL